MLAVFTVVGTLNGETIFETFDSDPLANGWTEDENETGSSFTYQNDLTTGYVGGGYLEVFMQRNPNTDRFTTSLSQTYTQGQEFWIEFDSSTQAHYQYQRGLFGVFNSASDNSTNVIADNFWRQKTSSSSSNFAHRVQSYDSSGSSTIYTSDYVFVKNEPIRAKLHYYVDGSSNGIAEFQLWRLNEAGAADDVLLADATGANSAVILDAGNTLSFDVFGFGNNDGTLNTTYTQRSWVDNLYFSTDGANTEYVDPAFAVPEPVSVLLFGLGSLTVLRLKKN
ncbi:hypothetical protein [Limihaloglobus sulfuriphilus]|nr:hypothetical protein [Limihaloglobus sulfuriphilus]